MQRTPDMRGKASEINDPMQLYARIGYRIFLAYRDGAREDFYAGYNKAELNRLLDLNPKS